jgi:nucleoside-diphosphate-sugar epimerase
MRVLVAGATSVPGLPLLRELNSRGHDVVGLTRQSSKTPQIEQAGAKPVVADVFDATEIDAVVADIEPEAVVSLLTTLPKWGPKRPKDFEPATKLWGRGAPNLVAAAQRAGVRRIVAESVIFAYGYGSTGPPIMDETDPYPGPPPPGGIEILAALRGMEQTVLTSHEHSGTEGIVLRYGVFYGPGVPHDELFVRLAKWWALPALTGNGILSWVHIDDVAKATADALERGRAGQIYNIVDDRPQSMGDYTRELSAKLHRPRPLPLPHRLVGLVASYPATAFGTTWLPLSNAKAKAELGWTPIMRNPAPSSRPGSGR